MGGDVVNEWLHVLNGLVLFGWNRITGLLVEGLSDVVDEYALVTEVFQHHAHHDGLRDAACGNEAHVASSAQQS